MAQEDVKRALGLITLIKDYGGWVVSIIMGAISIFMWLQSNGDAKYYPKLAGQYLEQEIKNQNDRFDKIEDQNNRILLLVGELKGGAGASSGNH